MGSADQATRLEAATELRRRGMCPIPVPPRVKNPSRHGWQRLNISEADLPKHFNGNGNIGLLTGEPSGGLVDVDLDAHEALLIAPKFLPTTSMIHGRPGKPDSHWWYLAPGSPTAKYEFTEAGAPKATMLVELRAEGCQTLVPPSVHPSGERYAWREFSEPGRVAPDRQVAMLAAAALLARHWPGAGSRHKAALALSGMLARAGWTADRIDKFVRPWRKRRVMKSGRIAAMGAAASRSLPVGRVSQARRRWPLFFATVSVS